MKPYSPRLLALSLAVLLTACAGPATRPDSSSAPLPDAPDNIPAVTVAEAFMTPPMLEHEIDSVAAWNTPDGDTWLIATGKETSQLVVYDGDTGAFKRTVGGPGDGPGQFNRPNGIAVYADLVFVVERDNQRVQVLRLPDFQPVAQFGRGELLNPYGLWLRETAPGELELLVTDSFMADFRTELVPPLDQLDGRVKRYRVQMEGDAPKATLLGQFGDTTPAGALRMVESIAGDPLHDRLLIAEEDRNRPSNLREYDLAGRFADRSLPEGTFDGEAEGVVLWSCGIDGGYWITVDQQAPLTFFHVFDRASLAPAGSFHGGSVARTDGIALHAAATARFPAGAFYAVHDDQAVAAFDLRDLVRALQLDPACLH